MLEVVLVNRAGVSYGTVVNARGVGVGRGVKQPRTARFTIGRSHPMRSVVRLTTRVLGKVYDVDSAGNRTLKFVGPITAHQRGDGDGGTTIELGLTDPAWYLARRTLNITNPMAPATHPEPYAVQRGHAMKWLLQVLNTDVSAPMTDPNYPGYPFGPPPYGTRFLQVGFAYSQDTGIRPRTIATTPTIVLPTTTDAPVYASDLIQTLTAGLDGPDWALYPAEPVNDGSPNVKLCDLDVAPIIGTTRPNVLFEFGYGKCNVASYQEVLDPATMANAIYCPTTDGLPNLNGGFHVEAQDATSAIANGLLEALVDAQGLDSVFGQQLISDHLAVRANARNIITFTVMVDPDPADVSLEHRRVPRAGVDFDFGDIVTFGAVEKIDVLAPDGTVTGVTDELVIPPTQVRVYNIDESDNDEGQRTMQLTVVSS